MKKEALILLSLLISINISAQEEGGTVKKSLMDDANKVAEEMKPADEAAPAEGAEATEQTAEEKAVEEAAEAGAEEAATGKESLEVKADEAMADKAEELATQDPSTKAAKEAADGVAVGAAGTDVIGEAAVRPDDWVHAKTLSVGFSGSYTNNNNLLVGATPGSFMQAGGIINGGWGMLKGGHEIMNEISWAEGIFYSPALGSLSDGNFQKATDNLSLTSTYKYHFEDIDWIGPYAKLNIATQVFNNWYLDGVKSNLDFETGEFDASGNPIEDIRSLEAQKKQKISSAFEPTTLQLDFGAFLQPKQYPPKLNYFFNLGLSQRSQFAQDGHIVTGVEAGTLADGSAGNLVSLTKLYDYNSFGLNGQANFNGAYQKNILWGLNVGAYYPLAIYGSNDPAAENAEGIDVLHMNVAGKISFMVGEYLSVDFVQRFIRDPFVTREWETSGESSFSNDWQAQSAILLSAGFNLL